MNRRIAQAELVFAGTLILVVQPFLLIAAPGFMEPMFGPTGLMRYAGIAVAGVGILGQVGGLVWMFRIARAEPEPDQAFWRYRAR